MTYSVKILGFGDNVVDKYEHIKTMFPGGNTVNFAVYGKRAGAERAAYMGIFGNDAPAPRHDADEALLRKLEYAGVD